MDHRVWSSRASDKCGKPSGEMRDEYVKKSNLPWSPSTVDRMIADGTLRRGEHFFYVRGRRDPLFKVSAIRELIENDGRREASERKHKIGAPGDLIIPMGNGGFARIPARYRARAEASLAAQPAGTSSRRGRAPGRSG